MTITSEPSRVRLAYFIEQHTAAMLASSTVINALRKSATGSGRLPTVGWYEKLPVPEWLASGPAAPEAREQVTSAVTQNLLVDVMLIGKRTGR